MTSEAAYEKGFSVEGFPMQYRWQTGLWYEQVVTGS